MCGISGIKRYGDTPISSEQIQLLLTGMEHRGNDATGILFQQRNGEIMLCKDNVPAWQFVTGKMYQDFVADHLDEDVMAVLLHTRAATGNANPIKTQNNHPIYYDRCAVIHNGMLSNDDELFRLLKLERRADTDSDILRAIVDKWGIGREGVNKLNLVKGSAAIAVVDPKEPGRLLLARSGSPICIGATKDMFVFASEKHIIHRAMRPWVQRFGIDFQVQTLEGALAFSPFPDDTAWMLGPEGLEWHQKFDTLTGQYRRPCYKVNDDYAIRQERWKNDAAQECKRTPDGSIIVQATHVDTTYLHPEAMQCPQCGLALKLSEKQRNMSLDKLSCPKDAKGCGVNLGYAFEIARKSSVVKVN